MFKFKKLWASWFGKSNRDSRGLPTSLTKEQLDSISAHWKQEAEVRASFARGPVRAFKARPTQSGVAPWAEPPCAPEGHTGRSSGYDDGMSILGEIAVFEAMTSTFSSDSPTTNDTPWDSGCGSDTSWSGDGGSSDGGGASGSWE